MRRESGINPKVYSWWYRNRKVRNRSRASTHITLSDFPWRRYQAAREKKRANIASTAQRAVEWRGRLFIPLFSRPRRVECEPEFVQLPRQANQERADGSGLDQNEAQTMAGGLSYIRIQPLSAQTSATSGKALDFIAAAEAGPASTRSKLDHDGQGTDERPLFLF